jgi:phosphoglycerol transferase MdoB-like AlkP superfamily enzyme
MREAFRKNLIWLFLRQFAFWLVFFAITCLVFLLWNIEETKGSSAGEVVSAFWYALYVDAAMISYFMGFSWLMFVVAGFWKPQLLLKINRQFQFVFIVAVSILTIAELSIYDEWHHKLTWKALWFLQHPGEVLSTATTLQLTLGPLSIAALIMAGIWLFRRFVPHEHAEKPQLLKHSLFVLLAPVFIFWCIRGGFFQVVPIQVSDAYYSRSDFLNTVSVNSTFHLFSNWFQNLNAGEPYKLLPQKEAETVFEGFMTNASDSTTSVLTVKRPNVVLVVLEGWSADLIEPLGGYAGITPHFNEMLRNGISFDSCYASGSLSDQGMAAIFSAFPAQPKTSVITQPDKYTKLPCLSKAFNNAGYSTSFMFGGQLSYGNIRAYMYYNKFGRITEEKDFGSEIPKGKLGAHDQYLFDRQLNDLEKEKQPFFAAMFTLSTHGPFDIPMKNVLNWGGKEKEYINSALYADRCIYNFLETAKKKPWYKNTLFVFVPDHSHNSPRNWSFNEPNYRRIPMVFYGDVVRSEYKGFRYKKVCSQIDLAATLLNQLELDASAFRYSKNLFNPGTPEFAYYAFDEGFGWIRPGAHMVYQVRQNRIEHEKVNGETERQKLIREGKAWLQVMTDEYWKF